MSGAHTDSDSGLQWHIRYRIAAMPGKETFWTYVTSDEQDARGLLALYQDDAALIDVALFVRDVSLWKEAES
jgi:hypothetical protein